MSSCTGIVILQYGNADATIACIESVLKYNTAPVKLIVVDNGSPMREDIDAVVSFLNDCFDDPVDIVEKGYISDRKLSEVTLVLSDTNEGYARGNNIGLEIAYQDSDIENLLVLNNDVLFVEDIIPALVNDLNSLAACAIVSPLLYKKNLVDIDVNCGRKEMSFWFYFFRNIFVFRDNWFLFPKRHIDINPNTGIKRVKLISGSCMMCKKVLFQSIGSFDPGTFLYYEENILWDKIKKKGLWNYVDSNLKCIHLGASTITRKPSRKILQAAFDSEYYYVRYYRAFGSIKASLIRFSQVWVSLIFSFREWFRV